MIRDEERREVAARLRAMQAAQFPSREVAYEVQPSLTTWEGIGRAVLDPETWAECDRLKSRDNRSKAVRGVIAGRLADLIDPGPSADRDALLELADELEENAELIIRVARNAQFTGCVPTMEEAKHCACEWRQIASRIREALGGEEVE